MQPSMTQTSHGHMSPQDETLCAQLLPHLGSPQSNATTSGAPTSNPGNSDATLPREVNSNIDPAIFSPPTQSAPQAQQQQILQQQPSQQLMHPGNQRLAHNSNLQGVQNSQIIISSSMAQGMQVDQQPQSGAEESDGSKARGGGKRELSTSKRAAQNRAAQRAFRQRKEGYIKKLEEQVREFSGMQESYKQIQSENYQLRDYIINLQSRLIESQGEEAVPPPPAVLVHPTSPLAFVNHGIGMSPHASQPSHTVGQHTQVAQSQVAQPQVPHTTMVAPTANMGVGTSIMQNQSSIPATAQQVLNELGSGQKRAREDTNQLLQNIASIAQAAGSSAKFGTVPHQVQAAVQAAVQTVKVTTMPVQQQHQQLQHQQQQQPLSLPQQAKTSPSTKRVKSESNRKVESVKSEEGTATNNGV